MRLLERYRPGRAVATEPRGAGRARSGGSRLIQIKTWLRRWRLSWWVLPAFEFYDLWVANAVRAGAGIVAIDPADAIVSSFGPPAAHKIGARLKRRFPKVLWVADYRDPWTFHDNFALRGATGYLELRREYATVGRHADLLVCVSNGLATQSRRFTAKPVIVVENGFDSEEQAEPLEASARVPDAVRAAWAPVTLVYTGTLHLDYQDPTPLLRAIGELVRARDAICEELRLLFFGDRHMSLQRLIEAEGVQGQVRVAGYVDRPTALWAQRNASALLLIENQESAARGLLRAKMYEYLAAARPILGIGFDADTEVGRILSETGAGRICGTDDGRIRDSLRALQARGTLDGFVPVPAVLQRFRRDVQARRLLDAMASL